WMNKKRILGRNVLRGTTNNKLRGKSIGEKTTMKISMTKTMA
ncbi:MAG: hypothetical protein ACI8RD_005768, partial [Bacillariaceae sp.]